MKTRIRRLEEDNSKKEKQIEQLLDPIKVKAAQLTGFADMCVASAHALTSVISGTKQNLLFRAGRRSIIFKNFFRDLNTQEAWLTKRMTRVQ